MYLLRKLKVTTMPNELKGCLFCVDEGERNELVNTRKLVERSLDNYAYVGVEAWLDEDNDIRIIAVTDKNKTFALAEGFFKINYCPMCGRDLRGADNG